LRNFLGETETEIVRNSNVLVDFEISLTALQKTTHPLFPPLFLQMQCFTVILLLQNEEKKSHLLYIVVVVVQVHCDLHLGDVDEDVRAASPLLCRALEPLRLRGGDAVSCLTLSKEQLCHKVPGFSPYFFHMHLLTTKILAQFRPKVSVSFVTLTLGECLP
jgi:hypothetical protein